MRRPWRAWANPAVSRAISPPARQTTNMESLLESLVNIVIEDHPFSIVTSYVPAAVLGRTFDAEDLTRHPLLKLLEKAGAIAVSARQSISAMAAEPKIARGLQTAIGQPLDRAAGPTWSTIFAY